MSHPLDPLSAEEIARAVALVRGEAGLDPSAWFETIALKEPSFEELAAGQPIRRLAHVACYEPATNRTLEGTVDLGEGRIVTFGQRAGASARIVSDEFEWGGKVALADPAFQAALAKRGISDVDKVLVEAWGAGAFGEATEAGERLAYGHCWLSNEAGDQPYARPIANLHPVIDLRRGRVVRIDDFGAVPLPPDPGPLDRAPLRGDLKPLEIVQDEGPSFTVEGHEVRWQRWRMRLGFNVREGLTLHAIGYEDKGEVRPIMHRAALSEMVVPYGDPTGGNYRRNAFDTGEYGVGHFLEELTLGCDCLGLIRYFDVVSHDWTGNPKVIRNAICMHEEDYGVLWKNPSWVEGRPRVVRSRRLVVSSIATIGNYVYGFYWYFYQDGTIAVEVKATGIPFPNAIAAGESSRYGRRIGEGIDGHVHQHSFSFRFDMAVDGVKNAVRELDFEGAPIGPDNRHGNLCRIIDRPLRRESEAAREIDIARARSWRVINPDRLNRHGDAVAYRLVPGVNALPFLDPASSVGQRAGFMFKHFWATPFHADELYAAGWYPNQRAEPDGLPVWTKADRNLEGEHVVVWYTLNYHHLPRPEDWPVQPVVYAGLSWMADGFFDENPALDVPERDKGHCGKSRRDCCD
ncbi:MAG: primary-amine oxidase [Hyphomicrobiaceae bacterium]